MEGGKTNLHLYTVLYFNFLGVVPSKTGNRCFFAATEKHWYLDRSGQKTLHVDSVEPTPTASQLHSAPCSTSLRIASESSVLDLVLPSSSRLVPVVGWVPPRKKPLSNHELLIIIESWAFNRQSLEAGGSWMVLSIRRSMARRSE